MRYHEFRAMNTGILFAAEGDAARLEEGFCLVEELVHQYESRFTRFSPDSELSALNRSSGTWFVASAELYELVSLSYDYFQNTGELFNPGILNALEHAGYNRSMDEIRTRGFFPLAEDGWPWLSTHFGHIQLDDERQAIFLPASLRIDLGGIAKGWIVERAAIALARFAQACLVDAGGDLFMVGLPEHTSAWTVAIEDPFDESKNIAVLSVGPGAVATSTITKRCWKAGGEERHHLIDPRTGRPAETGWASVTVIAPHATQAEVLAKSILIGGPGAAGVLLERFPDSAFIAVDRSGKLWGSKKSHKVLYGNDTQITVE